jgi:hypothetical protein
VAQVAPFRPEVVDVYDWDAEARHIGEVTGYPSDLMLAEPAVAALRASRAEAQAAQAQLAVIHGAADAAGKAAPMVSALADAQKNAQPAGAAA